MDWTGFLRNWTGTADLIDETELGLVACDLQMRDFGGKKRFAGTIHTVDTIGDFTAVRECAQSPGQGAILVVDAHALPWSAMLGDNIASAAISNGWEGIVVNGMVRDAAELSKLPIGIRALGTSPKRSLTDGNSRRDVPVSFGGITFRPGAPMWADEDGIVTSPVR